MLFGIGTGVQRLNVPVAFDLRSEKEDTPLRVAFLTEPRDSCLCVDRWAPFNLWYFLAGKIQLSYLFSSGQS